MISMLTSNNWKWLYPTKEFGTISHPEAFDYTDLFCTKIKCYKSLSLFSNRPAAGECKLHSGLHSEAQYHQNSENRIPSWGMGGRGGEEREWATTSDQTNLVFWRHTMFSFSFYLFQVLVQKVCADANATSPVSARSSNEQSFGVFNLVMFPLSEDL